MSITVFNLAHGETPPKGKAEKSSVARETSASVVARPKGVKAQDQNSPGDPEQVRGKMLNLLNVLPQFGPDTAEYRNSVAELQQRIQNLTGEQLAIISRSFDVASFSRGVSMLNAAAFDREMASSTGQKNIFSAQKKAKAPRGDISPAFVGPASHPLLAANNGNPPQPTSVPIDSTCGGVRNDTVTEFALLTTINTLNGAVIPLNVACASVTVILGEGTQAPFCIAAGVVQALQAIATAAFSSMSFCDGIIEGNETLAILHDVEHIHNDLINTVANDDQNKTMIVSNDNSNKVAIIADIDSKAAALSAQIDAGRTEILNKVESKGNEIIINDNVNRTQIINNDNTNTANIITNANANKTMIINNDNANFAATINELRALGCDVIRLLNTPDGQRSSSIASCTGKPGWPYSWNKTPSAPLSATSAKVSDPADGFSNQRGQDGIPILPLMGTVTMERHLLEGRLIPTYYLPSTKGGLIEQVKLLVWNTIDSQLELNIAKAETEQAKAAAQQADELLASKKYLEAYRQYCVAYQKLVPIN